MHLALHVTVDIILAYQFSPSRVDWVFPADQMGFVVGWHLPQILPKEIREYFGSIFIRISTCGIRKYHAGDGKALAKVIGCSRSQESMTQSEDCDMN